MPRLSVIIPTYNRWSGLDRLLRSLNVQTYDDFEVVIADDGSNYDVVGRISSEAFGFPITVCRQEDLGYRLAKARNMGISAAAGDIVYLVDDDCWAEDTEALLKISNQVSRNEEWFHQKVSDGKAVCACCKGTPIQGLAWYVCLQGMREGKVVWQDRRLGQRWDKIRWGHLASTTRFGQTVMGSGLVMRREDIMALGGYDERYHSGQAGEDSDLGRRLRRGKYILRRVEHTVLCHEGPPTKGGGKSSQLYLKTGTEKRVVAYGGPLETNTESVIWTNKQE